MATPYKQTKSNRGKTVHCVVCNQPIVAGEEYWQWDFFQNGSFRQHTSHGIVKAWRLATIKLQPVLQLIDQAEQTEFTPETVKDTLQEIIDATDAAINEYEESFDAMPEGLQQSESGQKLDEIKNGLQDYKDNIQSKLDEVDEDSDEDSWISFTEGLKETLSDYSFA